MIGHSLWDRVPQKLRLGLVPILTTALFVQAGSQTATLLSCLSRGTPFCDNPSKLSVTDIQGLLILVNFVVVFWFAYRTLGELVTKPGPISLDVKVIGLGTAFLSSVEIYGYALRNGVPERLVFVLPIIFFVSIVPFVLLRDARAGGNIDDSSETARQAYSALRQVVVAFVACAAATVAGSVYFVLLNEGLHFGHTILIQPLLVAQEAWVFNPAILGMGWIPVLCLALKSDGSNPHVVPLGMTANGVRCLLIAPLLINAAIGIVLIGDGNILAATTHASWALWLAKACLGAGLTVVFMAAFFLSKRFGLEVFSGVAAGAAIFAAAGALVGLATAGLRSGFGADASWSTSAVIHAGGFVITFLTGVAALRPMRRTFPDLTF